MQIWLIEEKLELLSLIDYGWYGYAEHKVLLVAFVAAGSRLEILIAVEPDQTVIHSCNGDRRSSSFRLTCLLATKLKF